MQQANPSHLQLPSHCQGIGVQLLTKSKNSSSDILLEKTVQQLKSLLQ
jgi:hypothetical protein